MIRISLSLTAAALAMVGAAHAADLPRKGAPQTFAPAVQSVPMWNGLYFGLNGGAIWGDFTKGGSNIDGKTAFTGGVTLGYQQQFGQFVAGVEGDYNYSGLSGRGLTAPAGIPVKGELSSFGTLRGRLGVAFDRALVFGTAGLALGNIELSGAPGKASGICSHAELLCEDRVSLHATRRYCSWRAWAWHQGWHQSAHRACRCELPLLIS
jgi:hypothetical protein